MRHHRLWCLIILSAVLGHPAWAGEEEAVQRLPRSTPERQGMASSAILSFVEAADAIDAMHSFMLVRHGQVVAEGWWGPYDALTPHMFYSLSKSFTSTAVGLAIAEGRLGFDDPVAGFFPGELPPEPSANLRALTIRHLLSMAAGHGKEVPLWKDDAGSAMQGWTWTRRFLAQPIPLAPGTHFLYDSPATFMLSAAVQQATGLSVLEYLRPRLFQPLGFAHPTWLANPQGITVGAYGLMGRTEDIACFGQLYLQQGVWKGRQLIPASWVAEATARQIANGSNPASDWAQGYGFQFWRCRHGAYRGDGAFGQYCIVIPDCDAVVAITSGVRDMQKPLDLVWDRLLPAMGAQALPDDDAARTRLESALAGLSVRCPTGQPTSSLAAQVSGRRYSFPDNERGIRAMTFDFQAQPPVLMVALAGGETRTAMGLGSWAKGKEGEGFANGLERALSVPAHPLVAASGAWTAEDVFTLKLALYQTPYHSTLTFRFAGEQLICEAQYHVAFGPTQLPRLVGQAARPL